MANPIATPHWRWTRSGNFSDHSWLSAGVDPSKKACPPSMIQTCYRTLFLYKRSIMRKIPCNLRMKSLSMDPKQRKEKDEWKFYALWFFGVSGLCISPAGGLMDGQRKEKRRHVWGSAKTGSSSPVQFTYWDGNGTRLPASWALFLHPLPIHPHSVYPQPNPAVSERSDKSFIQNITPHDWQKLSEKSSPELLWIFFKSKPLNPEGMKLKVESHQLERQGAGQGQDTEASLCLWNHTTGGKHWIMTNIYGKDNWLCL